MYFCGLSTLASQLSDYEFEDNYLQSAEHLSDFRSNDHADLFSNHEDSLHSAALSVEKGCAFSGVAFGYFQWNDLAIEIRNFSSG